MRASLLGAALLAVAACGSNSSSDPTNPVDPTTPTDPTDPPTPDESARDSDELAAIIAAHVRAEFPIQLITAEISKGNYPPGFSMTSQTDLTYTGTGSDGTLTYDFTYHCNDGTPAHTFVPCDGLAHHSHFKLMLAGSQSMGAIAMDPIQRSVDWEIRDLTLGKARFRGPDGLSLQTAVTTNGELAQYVVQFDAVYEQVRFLPNKVIPTAGTIDFTVNTERTRGTDHRVFNSTAHLAYGVSGAPTALTIDGVNYNLDLVTGDVVRL